MSDLRERAAIAAMVGLIQNKPVKGVREQMQDVIASVAVKCADALLAELARTAPVRPEPTAGACTAAERELIEATLHYCQAQDAASMNRFDCAVSAVYVERRDASVAKGGVQP